MAQVGLQFCFVFIVALSDHNTLAPIQYFSLLFSRARLLVCLFSFCGCGICERRRFNSIEGLAVEFAAAVSIFVEDL